MKPHFLIRKLLAAFLFFTCFWLPGHVHGEVSVVDCGNLTFTGILGSSIPVLLSVNVEEDKTRGEYRYPASPQPLLLSGDWKQDGTFRLQETVEDLTSPERTAKTTGGWQGTYHEDTGEARGTWESADGKKKLPFVLSRLALYKSLKSDLKYQVVFPLLAKDPWKSSDSLIQKEMQKVFSAGETSFRETFLEFKNASETDMTERVGNLEQESTYQVKGVTDQTLSLLGITYSYLGGAHPNRDYHSLNFRFSSGNKAELLALSELFLEGKPYVRELSRLIVANLKKQGASSVTSGDSIDFSKDIQENRLSFVISSAGISFFFPPYAVGCYAEGDFEVFVPFKKLKGLLRSEFQNLKIP